ncbi:MAG: N-acetyl-gamma-glutamyl-phosphate reductase [Leptospirales bacterium]|nr:N-acetyl-gamma-glutamyl-phosphate reductase [Leptospirales bacterium]
MSQPNNSVAVLGAAGFTGKEILRILAAHPSLSLVHITSDKYAGKTLSESFPELPRQPGKELTFQTHDAVVPQGAFVLMATPNEVSMARVPELVQRGHRVVDLSGAFRLHDRARFLEYYKLEHTAFDLMQQAAFGIPELFKEKIQSARLVANPGCFPTGVIIPLSRLAAFQADILGISIDAKSGVSGAGGRTEDGGFSYTSVYENFRAYKILGHQHWPEIVEYGAPDLEDRIVFTPHLLPLFRGILSTITVFWKSQAPDLHAIFNKLDHPFVRVLPTPEEVQLNRVQHTNYLDIGLRSRGKQTVIVTALDNLVKGAAGQAIQNLNLMAGIQETTGLV